jgi:hypothetical protein
MRTARQSKLSLYFFLLAWAALVVALSGRETLSGRGEQAGREMAF